METTEIDTIRNLLLMFYSDDSLRTAQRALVDAVITRGEYLAYQEVYLNGHL